MNSFTAKVNRNKKLVLIFIILSVLNVLIFIYREYFQFNPFKNYKELYLNDSGNWNIEFKKVQASLPEFESEKNKWYAPSSSTETRAIAIGNMIYASFQSKIGSNYIKEEYEGFASEIPVLNSNNIIECGTISNVFTFYCSMEGIKSRNIEIMKPGDHHVLNEFFDDKSNKWRAMDITHGLMDVRDIHLNPLNLIELKNQVNSANSLLIKDEKTGIYDTLNSSGIPGYRFYRENHPLYYYHSGVNQEVVYSISQKIKRYVFPVSWYSIYKDKPYINLPHYFKMLTLFCWALLIPALFIKLRGSK